MIFTVARIGWLQFRRSPPLILIVFAVPIVFFSIFALIFGGQSQNAATSSVDLALVDEDDTESSRQLVAALEAEAGLDVYRPLDDDGQPRDLDREAARELERDGRLPVALVLPVGLGESFPNFGGQPPTVILLSDPSDPIAPQIVGGLLQKVMMTAMPTNMIKSGVEQFDTAIGGLTPEQQQSLDGWMEQISGFLENDTGAGSGAGSGAASGVAAGMVDLQVEDVLGNPEQDNPIISFYAAAIAVMFLLFSASGAGGSLLEEEESQTLERLLSTRLSMGGLLLGKWLNLTVMGVAQILLMFLWGWAVFGLDLFSHLPGFAVMTLATAAAASGFGLVLATLARSRAQLSGLSTIVILSMSALGGSMFPRFMMSDAMQRFGLLTFNAWAIDGYIKVFWREAALWELWPQVGVLVGLTVVFMGVARVLARRWEVV